jgi:hypothetical protein
MPGNAALQQMSLVSLGTDKLRGDGRAANQTSLSEAARVQQNGHPSSHLDPRISLRGERLSNARYRSPKHYLRFFDLNAAARSAD